VVSESQSQKVHFRRGPAAEQLLKEKDAERRSKAAKEEDDAGYTLPRPHRS